MASSKISKLTSGGAVISTDELIVARGGGNFKLTAAQVSALALAGALLPANNLSDVADAATSLTNLGGVATTDPRAMQLYAPSNFSGQTLIVDANGNGDYTRIAAAVAAALLGDTILVMSSIGEVASIVIDKNIDLVIGPGVTVNGNFSTPAIEIQSPNRLVLSGMGGSSINGVFGPAISMTGAGLAILDVDNIRIGTAAATTNVVLVGAVQNRIQAMSTYFGTPWQSATNGLNVPGALSTSFFFNCHFGGNGKGATSTVAWANAPFYNCSFYFGRTNITFAAGNNSNVDL